MMLAVVDRHANVLQRKPRDRALHQHLLDAFLHGRNELIGNRAALDRILEFEARASRQRLESQGEFAELAGAAGLLLVPMMALRLAHDCFAVRHAWRARLDLDLELAGHALE